MENRCPATNEKGIRCGLPKGHEGTHQNGPSIRTWTKSSFHPANALTHEATTNTKPEATPTSAPSPTPANRTPSPTATPARGATSPFAPALTINPQTVDEVIINLERSRRELQDIDRAFADSLRVMRELRGITITDSYGGK